MKWVNDEFTMEIIPFDFTMQLASTIFYRTPSNMIDEQSSVSEIISWQVDFKIFLQIVEMI